MAPRKQPSTTAAARKATAPTKGTNGGIRKPSAAKPENGRKAATGQAQQTQVNTTGHTRLGKGDLEKLVADHLKAHPNGDYSPSELARVLTRSGGAIANALERLVRDGNADRVSDKPRRYRLAASGRSGKARGNRR